jgi:hypothetical protein
VESIPREMENMSDFFNPIRDQFGDIDENPVRDQFHDAQYFAKRYVITIHRKTCSSGIENPLNRGEKMVNKLK